jgi:hypothetical protein
MKKHMVISALLVVFAFIVGYFVGDTTAINRANKQISANVESEQSEQSEQSESKDESKVYKAGEEGLSGNWNIKVLDVNETNIIQAGNSSNNKTTKEKFIVLKIQMENISKQPVQYSPDEFKLGSMEDQSQYNVDFDAMMTANHKETIYNKNSEFIGVYDDVNPNTYKKTYIVFEVPKDMNISDGVLINANGGAEATGFYLQ